jgi:hypothetical protein
VITLWQGLPAVVAVNAGQVVTLAPATMQTGARPRLAGSPAGEGARAPRDSIAGRVTGKGHPLAGICVLAFPVNGGNVPEAITTKTGTYRITGLPRGRYQVEFADMGCQSGNWLSQWYPNINTPFPADNATVFTMRAGLHITGIDGHLRLGGQISGVVRSRSGKRLSGICVDIEGDVQDGGVGIGLNTNRNGYFAVQALFPGQYTGEFQIGCGSKGNYAFQWWRGATSASRATVIKITGHRIFRNMNPVLGPGAAITGQVRGRDAAGPPLPGVCVTATGSDGNDYADSITMRGGRYEVLGLASGRYQILFDPTCGFGPPPINYVARTRSIHVTAGRTVPGFNAYLAPGAILSGKVTDAHGHPVASVCVLLGDPNGDATRTSLAGTYSIIGIPPGAYTVGFSGGCGNAGSLAPQSYNNQADPQAANLVRFTGGKTTANIDAVMQPGGTVAGVVTDRAGHRLNRVCVGAISEGLSGFGGFGGFNVFGGGFGGFAATAITRAGRYRIANLEPGPYQIVFFNCGFGGRYAVQWFLAHPEFTTADLVSVTAGVVTRASAALALAGRITGTVTDKAGHGLSNVCVSIENAKDRAGGFPTLVAASEGGHYQIGGLPAGNYLVQFSQCFESGKDATQWYRDKTTAAFATTVPVMTGRTTQGINAVLTAGGSIAGTVTGPAGKPVRGFCVQAFDRQAQAVSIATTTRAGRYTLTGLATGRYMLDVFPCSPGGPNLAAAAGLALVTAPQAVTGVDVKLRLGGSVSGTVTGSGASMTPQHNACVVLLPTNPNGVGEVTVTHLDGRYRAANLAAGTYRVYFGDPFCDIPMAGLAPQWYKGALTQATAKLVTVAFGRTKGGIDAALQPFGSISGTVTDGVHAPVAGECATAVPFHAPADPFTGTPASQEIAITTRSGAYTLNGLPPGRYKVEFAAGCGDSGFATQWWKDADSAKSAKVITVRSAAIIGIDATLRS